MEMYFTTSTVKDWIRLFDRPDLRGIVLESLRFVIRDHRIQLHGYVLMPNHLHLIFSPIPPQTISTVFRDFHKYTSQQMIKILRNEHSDVLNTFTSPRTDRLVQIWQATHAPKEIESATFFRQKLDYIHNNPCSERWLLSNTPEEYLYSSARDYILGEVGMIEITKIPLS
jgi:REP element-mobilizing transposase RayT